MSIENRIGRTIAGLCVIAFGVLTLLTNTWQSNITVWLWIGLLAVATLAFGWIYSREGETWTLIFSYITGAVGLLIFLIEINVLFASWVAIYVLLAIGVPFVFGWLRDRKQWGLLVPAYVMTAIALMLFLLDVLDMGSTFVPAYVMFVIGVPFVFGWLRDRKQWGLLVPAYVMTAIALMLLLLDVLDMGSTFVPAYVMFVIGLPFLIGAFVAHNRWLLFPAGVMLFIGATFVFTSVDTMSQVLPIVGAAIFIIAGALMLLPERQHDQEAKLKH